MIWYILMWLLSSNKVKSNFSWSHLGHSVSRCTVVDTNTVHHPQDLYYTLHAHSHTLYRHTHKQSTVKQWTAVRQLLNNQSSGLKVFFLVSASFSLDWDSHTWPHFHQRCQKSGCLPLSHFSPKKFGFWHSWQAKPEKPSYRKKSFFYDLQLLFCNTNKTSTKNTPKKHSKLYKCKCH